MEYHVKKNIFIALFVIIFVSGLYGQTLPENRWLLGRWTGVNSNGINIEIIFNDNGTGRFNTGGGIDDRVFSINGDVLRFFNLDGRAISSSWNIFRINDQRIILQSTTNLSLFINLNKMDQ